MINFITGICAFGGTLGLMLCIPTLIRDRRELTPAELWSGGIFATLMAGVTVALSYAALTF